MHCSGPVAGQGSSELLEHKTVRDIAAAHSAKLQADAKALEKDAAVSTEGKDGKESSAEAASTTVTPAHVLLRWGLQRGAAAVLPKSVTAQRIRENFAVSPGSGQPLSDWRLSEADMEALAKFDCGRHFAWDPSIVR
jgi:diketogulonate reductase-like aldo/keto reductase